MELLVSVRSADEALIALEGGAGLIDIKEPARGALGRADAAVIASIVTALAGRRPISAALGEWREEPELVAVPGLTYVKWGLAGCARQGLWRQAFRSQERGPKLVFVAYADWQCAQAPSVADVFALACEQPGNIMLVDTHCKDASTGGIRHRPTLLDWMPPEEVMDLCARARAADIRMALAGSLGIPEIRALLPARPDWFAVRGAVCGGDRQATVKVERVRQLAELIESSSSLTAVNRGKALVEQPDEDPIAL